MLKYLVLMVIAMLSNAENLSSSKNKTNAYTNKTDHVVQTLTSSAGAPVDIKDTETTLNKVLLADEFFVETITHFVRERIPVRPVHPKGAGAFGHFKLLKDLSDVCKAEFLNGVGKITPVAVRLSMGATERGGSDLTREPRGFAVKHYTKEGIFDIAGFNTPIFVYKEPMLFTPFARVTRKSPGTDIRNINMLWDFLTLHPESLFIFLIVFSDEGVPNGYRYMPGHSIHAYPLYNEAGKLSYARFHYLPVGGIKYLNSTEAARLGGQNPDYSAQELYDAISRGESPTWDVYIQLLSEDDFKNAKTFDPFDVTQVIPEDIHPLTKIGELVLDTLPENYFADVEQLAYCPSNLVPGILGPPDKTFEARRFAYRDSQRYRLGANFDNIVVNYPYRSKPITYNRDGKAPVLDNGSNSTNYFPNSFNGPVPYVDKNRPDVPKIFEKEANNTEQVRNYYVNRIVGDQRIRLVDNIADSLCGAVDFLQDRAIKEFSRIHDDLGSRVDKRLKERNCKK